MARRRYLIRTVPGEGGGGGDVPAGAAVMTDDFPSLTIVAADTNVLPTDDITFEIEAQYDDNVAAQVEALALRISGFDDTTVVPTDAGTVTFREWATASADNDSSQTTPTNANGQPNGTLCVVKTNNSLGDLSNPVRAHSGYNSLGATAPAGLLSKGIRFFYSSPARSPSLDTLTLYYGLSTSTPVGSGVTVKTLGASAEDFLSAGYYHDLTSMSWADYRDVVMSANYQAAVVALPEGRINIDAWCWEYTVPF